MRTAHAQTKRVQFTQIMLRYDVRLLVSREEMSRVWNWFLCVLHITKTCQFKYTENLTTKTWKFSDKKFWYFFIFLLKTYIVGTR